MDATDLVWYAAYGSNLCGARLRCYFTGEQFKWGGVRAKPYPGTADVRQIVPISIPFQLYFARRAAAWNGQGVGFIDLQAPGMTLGRAYLMTCAQFEHLFRSENGQGRLPEDWLHCGAAPGAFQARSGWYRLLVPLGAVDGVPAFTFTNPHRLRPAMAPSRAYLFTIVQGLRETYALEDAAIVAYLADKPGIERLDPASLRAWTANPPPED